MRDTETFLLEVYVLIDDLIRTEAPPLPTRPGPAAALSPSEIVTLALFSQWQRFPSERAFYRYATTQLVGAFPRLPSRPQFNRQVRRLGTLLAWVAVRLSHLLGVGKSAYEVLDGTAIPVRTIKRRHRGWLHGLADHGFSNRLGYFHGVRLLLCVTPEGVVTGFGVGPASSNDRHLAETFFALRARPDPGLPSIGLSSGAPYLADMGFTSEKRETHWAQSYGATVLAQPLPQSSRRWSRPERRWFAGRRQIVETVFHCLQSRFRLTTDRPHSLDGLLARMAAKIAFHNCCICFNRRHGYPDLAITELLPW